MNCAHCTRLLDARLDGELDAATAADFDAHLRTCSECLGRHNERLALGAVLRVARDETVAPPALVQRIRSATVASSPARRWRAALTWGQALAFGLATAAVASIVTFAILKPTPSPQVDPLAALAERHVASLGVGAPHGAAVQVASSERHQVKPWFQGRVPLTPPVPDLASEGFELLGGRVERFGGHDAAVVVYRIRKHPVELYAWLDSAPAAQPQQESARGFSIVRWRADGLAFAAISDLNAQDLARFASAVEARRR